MSCRVQLYPRQGPAHSAGHIGEIPNTQSLRGPPLLAFGKPFGTPECSVLFYALLYTIFLYGRPLKGGGRTVDRMADVRDEFILCARLSDAGWHATLARRIETYTHAHFGERVVCAPHAWHGTYKPSSSSTCAREAVHPPQDLTRTAASPAARPSASAPAHGDGSTCGASLVTSHRRRQRRRSATWPRHAPLAGSTCLARSRCRSSPSRRNPRASS